jgi:prevent-host-death family protein
MISVTATEAKQNFGACLMNVAGGPILIEKSGKPAAVLMSHDEYQRLMHLENAVLLNAAANAIEEGFLDPQESRAWFARMNSRAGEEQ